jgi:hypothetical protein
MKTGVAKKHKIPMNCQTAEIQMLALKSLLIKLPSTILLVSMFVFFIISQTINTEHLGGPQKLIDPLARSNQDVTFGQLPNFLMTAKFILDPTPEMRKADKSNQSLSKKKLIRF